MAPLVRSRVRSRGRRVALRALLVVVACVATLALVEGTLRLLFRGDVASLTDSRRKEIAAGADVILCVGDSYTFGLYYRPEEAWPARLEQLLALGARPDGDPRPGVASFVVENAGIPAQNLWQIEASLRGQLERLKPRAVVVLGGFNNRWNMGRPEQQGALRRLFESLVLVRLARLAVAPDPATLDGRSRIETFERERIRVAGSDGSASIEVDKSARPLEADAVRSECAGILRDIVALCRSHGALPILCNYPSPERGYEAASQAAVEVAASEQVPLVDLRGAFARELTKLPYAELFIPGDRHPTDRGHWRMACLVAQALADAGRWRPEPEVAAALAALDRDGYAVPKVPELVHPVTCERDGASLLLHGPPHARFRVALSGGREPPVKFGRRELPLAGDDCFRRFADDPRLAGTLGDDGAARVAIPADAAGAAFAAAIVFHDVALAAADLTVRKIVGPVALR
jgi:lysophospholipase L1-like esterase